MVILDSTPFYAESGGQVGDTGVLAEQGVEFDVADTLKFAGQFHGHVGRVAKGSLKVGDVCEIEVEGIGCLRNPVVAGHGKSLDD